MSGSYAITEVFLKTSSQFSNVSGSYAVTKVFLKTSSQFSDVSGSYAVTEVFLKTSSSWFDGSDEEFRGKTPQSGYETKNHFTVVQKLGDGFQEKLKASRSVNTGFYSN